MAGMCLPASEYMKTTNYIRRRSRRYAPGAAVVRLRHTVTKVPACFQIVQLPDFPVL